MSSRAPLPSRVLIPVANPETAGELVRIGAALLDERTGRITALGIVEVPEAEALSEGATRARTARRLLQRVLEFAPPGIRLQPLVRIGRRAAEGIVEAVAEQEADLVIFGWAGDSPGAPEGIDHSVPAPPTRGGPKAPARRRRPAANPARVLPYVFSPTIDEVARTSPCDIAVVKQRGLGSIRRVLVPVRGGPHAELALQFADAIATRDGGEVVALHILPSDVSPAIRAQAERALSAFVKQHVGGHFETLLRESSDVAATILRESQDVDLVVMGASAEEAASGGGTYLFGALPESIAARARSSVIVVKTRERLSRQTFEHLSERAETLAAADRAAENARSVRARVERWFGESNFDHSEFGDLGRLLGLKQMQDLTISLVLPTLNEEATIGPIVGRALHELMGRVPLLDEILVIDSASDDRTREIALAEGARVVVHQEVLARYGSFAGKGEALWKSLYETSGDLVVWADTDVRNWHSRMAYGTLGPLLAESRIQYVKGYYQRPIVENDVLLEGGGGRVTELVARPLLNLFYPELSGFIQPLAGEYAGRHSLLESIPFFTGYAVEIGHLIDVAERVGLEGLGQVDLERRQHRNQELEGLSKMSFVILQAVMKRLEERRRARLFAELGSSMKLPRSSDDRLSLEVIEVADHERPPMLRIPEYLERRSAAGAVAGVEVGR